MESIERRGLSQQINDLLLEIMVSGRLRPGQKLKETELAEELGVSRTPVREALNKLEGGGFVTIIPRRGVFVSEVDSRRLEDILDFRYLLEMYGAERGVERISQKDLREMRSLVQECESLVGRSDRHAYNQYVRRDRDFHTLIVKSGDNSVLTESYERLAVFLQIAQVQLTQSRPNMVKGHREHKAILAAYEARDRDRVLQALGSQLRRSKNEVLEVAGSVMH